jgi:hypothetical protein
VPSRRLWSKSPLTPDNSSNNSNFQLNRPAVGKMLSNFSKPFIERIKRGMKALVVKVGYLAD